ncbi:protein FATTY ACID EXPORT 3, chloroplastic isoform X2 [Solanum dulcamara]|uniref:protein FATTY ACID EXPORT 3, chloroplastic isoform X2 n=1 Tax=Solanum dulcamara TaxID=45834 RepID=UPI0024851CEC|nr:protein FATTY ACID EXPORT 3, chloroplastic isoform X2 [Solanum dulcamara]
MALSYTPTSLGFTSTQRLCKERTSVVVRSVSKAGLGFGFRSGLVHHSFRNKTILPFAASHEESPSDVELEKDNNDLKEEAEAQEEAWKQTLASFKEQAMKVQAVSQEAYEVYSDKAMIILKETSEKLKIQADKAREDLTIIAKEISEESKEYLSTAAENSPEPVKDIVETFVSSADELNDLSKVRDFYVGIPYGTLLSASGFLYFMLSGSTAALRFGVILGGTILALSVSSLRSWKSGESTSLALKGQAAIATILFVREFRMMLQRPFIFNFVTAIISGGVAVFYAYRILKDGEQTKGSNSAAQKDS